MGFSPATVVKTDTVRVELTHPLFRDEAGEPLVMAHEMRVEFGGTLRKIGRLLERAGSGLKAGDARDEAQRRALFDAWESLVEGVEGYDGAEGLKGADLRAYMEGKAFPADTPGLERWKDVVARQIDTVLGGYFDQLKADPSFRR